MFPLDVFLPHWESYLTRFCVRGTLINPRGIWPLGQWANIKFYSMSFLGVFISRQAVSERAMWPFLSCQPGVIPPPKKKWEFHQPFPGITTYFTPSDIGRCTILFVYFYVRELSDGESTCSFKSGSEKTLFPASPPKERSASPPSPRVFFKADFSWRLYISFRSNLRKSFW